MESEDENLCRFGTALEPLKEDEVPTKKPILIEDQIVTDENGKRRFHGAFTGGFSAGFWNTVGSLEGWKPKEFKSSRNEKAEHKKQKPIDFMDDEDMGEFGIAPQRVQATEDFSNENSQRKRKFEQKQSNDGPIPGVPVLHQLLRPARDGVAIRLLKQMGWKQGQGIGERMSYQKKKLAAKYNDREQYVMQKYGCDVGEMKNNSENEDGTGNKVEYEQIDDDNITFAPDDFEPYICVIKDNLFGIGYSGLSRDSVLSSGQHVNLFGNLEVLGKNNKKLSIRGQAFGVGALEEEDEDIYQKDDMTKYDFSLGKKNSFKGVKPKTNDAFSLEGFHEKANSKSAIKKQFILSLPIGFVPRNWLLRKSRFEPLDEKRFNELKKIDEHKARGLGKHDLNPEQRGNILGEPSTSAVSDKAKTTKTSEQKLTYLDKINKKYEIAENSQKRDNILSNVANNIDKFTSVEKKTILIDQNIQIENKNIIEKAKEITKDLCSIGGSFKPFAGNYLKQERYENFIENVQSTNDVDEIRKFLKELQPIEMNDWDREMEMKEFIQAKRIYQPLKGLMSDRFISEINLQNESVNITNIKETANCVKKKTIRVKSIWKACSQLCKRFNIAEPYGGTLKAPDETPSTKPKYSVFDYIETSVNRKDTFITPVIIPKKQPETDIKILNKKLDSNIAKIQVTNENNFSIKDSPEKVDLKTSDALNLNIKIDMRIPSVNLPKERIRSKTDLEIKIEENKSKHPSEKKDIFKAIFESSDEEDNENENAEKTEMQDTSKTDILKELTKPASEINVLRNNSPPRGIFAAFFNKSVADDATTSLSMETTADKIKICSNPEKCDEKKIHADTKEKILFTPSYKRLTEKNIDKQHPSEVYGPKLPEKIINLTQACDENNDHIDEKLLKIITNNGKEKIVEAWVEKQPKNVASKKSHQKHKKKSKSKDKHKEKDSKKMKDNIKSRKKKSKSKDSKKDRKSKKKDKQKI